MAACPRSPEAGYHRFQLPPSGTLFLTQCVYCALPKLLRPFAEDDRAEEARSRRRRLGHVAVLSAVPGTVAVPLRAAPAR